MRVKIESVCALVFRWQSGSSKGPQKGQGGGEGSLEPLNVMKQGLVSVRAKSEFLLGNFKNKINQQEHNNSRGKLFH